MLLEGAELGGNGINDKDVLEKRHEMDIIVIYLVSSDLFNIVQTLTSQGMNDKTGLILQKVAGSRHKEEGKHCQARGHGCHSRER